MVRHVDRRLSGDAAGRKPVAGRRPAHDAGQLRTLQPRQHLRCAVAKRPLLHPNRSRTIPL